MFWRWMGALTVRGQPELGHPAGDVELLLRGAGIGADPLGILGIDVLERDLHVVEAALGEVLETARLSVTAAVIRFE